MKAKSKFGIFIGIGFGYDRTRIFGSSTCSIYVELHKFTFLCFTYGTCTIKQIKELC